jgi:hypothetical protein
VYALRDQVILHCAKVALFILFVVIVVTPSFQSALLFLMLVILALSD